MTAEAVSRARSYRVTATGRSLVLVPMQPVPRKVTIAVVGPGSVYITSAAAPHLRGRPELPDQTELPPDVRLPIKLMRGQGLWCITRGPLIPVAVFVEYLWDQDPSAAIDDAKLVASQQDVTAYDDYARRQFAGLLCNDPFLLMVAQQEQEQQQREAAEGVVDAG